MAKLNLQKAFEGVEFKQPEMMLGKGSMQPFNASNSGSRKIMFGTHLEQRLPLCRPDVPYLETGHEKQFGLYSSSFMVAEHDYDIISKIPKYSAHPSHHFFLIAVNHDDKEITVFEKKIYKHITESYGYMYSDDAAINTADPGCVIPKYSVIMKSKSFDENNNRMDGKNLLTMYTACEETMEDAIVISESAAQALSSPLVKKVNIVINDNDIPLNLYGDREVYKIMPDIGEHTNHGILCGLRIEKKEECLYSLSLDRLREMLISDQPITVSGKIVDIDVYANAPDKLAVSPYCGQLYHYYQDNIRMCKEIVDTIEVKLADYIRDGYRMDYDMQKLYSKSRDILLGKQYYASGKVFSNLVVEVTVIEEIPVLRGDKLTNRYGGKGIVSSVRPDYMMPKTEDGKTVDALFNICGVFGRENVGQLFELSVSHVSMKIAEYFRLQILDVGECIDMLLQFLQIVAPSQYEYMDKLLDSMDDDNKIAFISCIMDDQNIYTAIEPMSENMTLTKLDQLYETFPWITLDNILMPLEDSNGKYRYVNSRRPVLCGYQYIYRLKQYAEEKFSVTSLSSTNIKNENTRNKASNNYKALFARTPIRFGEMEIGNMLHMGADIVSQILMLYSSSPHGRRLCEELLTGDPFNIDVRLDNDAKNRNAEILNVYLKTKGVRLVFNKKLKIPNHPILIEPMVFDDPELIDPIIFYNKDEKFDIEWAIEQLKASRKRLKSPMVIQPIEFDRTLEEIEAEKKEKKEKGES